MKSARLFFFLIVSMHFSLQAQFSVSGGLQCHIEGSVAGGPFTSFNQLVAEGAWQKKHVQFSGAVSGIHEYQQLEQYGRTDNHGSNGGPAPNTTYWRAAKVEFNYVGFRAGVDFVLGPEKEVRLLIGTSVHLDHLVSFKAYDFIQSSVTVYSGDPSWTPNPGSGAFINYAPVTHEEVKMLQVDENYLYENVGFKLQCHLERFQFELQLMGSYFDNPRVRNVYENPYAGEPFHATRFQGGYIGGEFGFSVGYTFPKKEK